MPRIEITTNVPKAELQKKINRYMGDSDYISHKATPEDAGEQFWTLEVILKDN
ncbi:MAG: hypothetical protein RW306_02820 [Geobacteraceae bacterium]|nr:hypothetical protein [Geobacteraceae bacterium]